MNHSRSGLFLMEFTIAILFFALSSVVCIQLYVQSHQISRQATEQTNSCMWSENIAELFYALDQGNDIARALSDGEGQTIPYDEASGSITLSFDEDWMLIENSAEAAYRIVATFSNDAETAFADIHVTSISDASEIYSLRVQKHLPLTRNEKDPL